MRFLLVLAAVFLTACAPQTRTPEPKKENPTWGKRYAWPDGLAIEVAAPQACTPGEYALPDGIKRAAKFKVVIVNDSQKPYEAVLLTTGHQAQFAGVKAERVIDMTGACKDSGLDTSTVLPGKTYTFEVAYAVGAEPGEMQLSFQPDFTGDKAIYVGQV